MPAWPFCYCLIVKIWTLVERPLLAQSGRSYAKGIPEAAYQFGIRLGEGALLGPRHLRVC
jgi:hypothetical protein